MRPTAVRLLVVLAMLAAATPAFADLTAFVGASPAPANRAVRGFAVGFSLLVVGFEFELSDTAADTAAGAPAVRTGMFNMHVQTPFGISGLQFYGTAGGGLYHEEGHDLTESNAGTNAGGGVKIAIAGPIRVRVDYRVFKLRGSPERDTQQRIYAGVNIGF
ncbi:MAG TPA: hypothetical protein DIU48_10375 [Acidobacteria bacterium]|nr:hypothetical protein [Acidobacteriota bacterium]